MYRKEINNWIGLNVKYQISFYNEGKLFKKIEYLTYKYDGENDLGTEFRTPNDKFDEIKIAAYPVKDEEISNDLEGMFNIITTKDSNLLKETILKYGSVHATSFEDSRLDFSSAEVINAYTNNTISFLLNI